MDKQGRKRGAGVLGGLACQRGECEQVKGRLSVQGRSLDRPESFYLIRSTHPPWESTRRGTSEEKDNVRIVSANDNSYTYRNASCSPMSLYSCMQPCAVLFSTRLVSRRGLVLKVPSQGTEEQLDFRAGDGGALGRVWR